MFINMGFDFGYGYIKAADSNGGRISFPTLYKPWVKSEQDLETFEHIVNIDGSTYAVGEFAAIGRIVKRWSKSQQLSEQDLRIYLGTALYLLTKRDSDKEIDVNISVGLPVDHYNLQRERLTSILNGLIISAEDKRFRISRVLITQQGLGAFYSLLVDVNGTSKELNEDLQYGGGIIDVGYRTTDLIKVDYTPKTGFITNKAESGTLDNMGMSLVYNDVAGELNAQYGTSLSQVDVENSLKDFDGDIIISRQRIDIKPLFIKRCEILGANISNAVASRWPDTETFGAVYLSGGGAVSLIGKINLTGVNIVMQDNPSFANVEGYLAKLNLISA